MEITGQGEVYQKNDGTKSSERKKMNIRAEKKEDQIVALVRLRNKLIDERELKSNEIQKIAKEITDAVSNRLKKYALQIKKRIDINIRPTSVLVTIYTTLLGRRSTPTFGINKDLMAWYNGENWENDNTMKKLERETVRFIREWKVLTKNLKLMENKTPHVSVNLDLKNNYQGL